MTEATDCASRLYEAFGNGDMEALGNLLADVDWHEAKGMPYGGRYSGFQQVAENVFGPIGGDVEGFTAQPDEIVSLGDDRAVAFGVYRGNDGAVATPYCHVWTAADGRMTKFVQYADSHLYRQQANLLDR